MGREQRAQALVIGGGLHGLAAAWHLRRLGVRSVLLLERFRLGHDRGSSHGATRITRSAYPSPAYVHLLQAANREEWPRLERACGTSLRQPARACFFGPAGGLYDAFASTMAPFDQEVSFLTPAEAARRFPELRFEGAAGVIEDRTAGVVAAARTMQGLARLCVSAGVAIVEDCPVSRIEVTADGVRAIALGTTFVGERGVVAAGPWSSALLPFLAPHLTVIRQTVGYFRLGGGGADPSQFPVWAYLGEGRNDFYYGLPQFEHAGVKVARHVTAGSKDDPDGDGSPREEALADLRRLLNRVFVTPVTETVGAETCLYTVTPNEDFVIGLHPESVRLAFGAGFSGHGFKFGPLTGRILAELALSGVTTVPEFERHRGTFALPAAQ